MELVRGLFRESQMLGFGPTASSPLGATDLNRYASQFDEHDFRNELLLFSPAANELILKLQSQPGLLTQIDPFAFEELVAELFYSFGYQVELTKQTRDGGCDIIAARRTEVDLRLLIECKRTEKIRVGVVRQLKGVLDSNATKAILATTGFLTPEATMFVAKHKWQLEAHDRDAIVQWINCYTARKA